MFKICSACLFTFATLAVAGSALADDDSTQASQASQQSAAASARLAAVGVKVVVGIALAPVFRAGRESRQAGQALTESGQAIGDSRDAPLQVSPETVVAQPAPQVPYNAQTSADDDQTAQATKTAGQP